MFGGSMPSSFSQVVSRRDLLKSLGVTLAMPWLESLPLTARASLRGVDSAKFRRSVVTGDRLRLEVTLRRARARLARLRAFQKLARGVSFRGEGAVVNY